MKSVRTPGVLLVLAASLAVIGCGKKEEPKAAAPAPAPVAAPAPAPKPEMVVKIGHVAPLTGPIAHLGKDNENGARLAVDDANAKKIEIDGKVIKFELLGEDDQADPKTGTVVAQKLVDAKVAGVVGHLNSGTTIPASAIYNQPACRRFRPRQPIRSTPSRASIPPSG
jgi:branched-chain amino acid transport system substrate-binding protein